MNNDKFNILWFTNTPAGGEEILKSGEVRGGWLSSLDKAIREKVDLSVAFNYARYIEPFENAGVRYFPICKKNWRSTIIKNKIFGDYIDQEDLPEYLKIIEQVKPDIIHIHGTENPYSCLTGKTDIPLVISIQGNYTVYNHKYFSGIEREFATLTGKKLTDPRTWLINRSWKRRFRISSIPKTEREKRNLLKCRHIIGRTDWDRRITRILAPSSNYYHNDEILRDSFYNYHWTKHCNSRIIVHTTTGEAIFKGFETVCMTLNELNKIGFEIEWRVAGVAPYGLLDKVVRNKLKGNYPKAGLMLLGNLDEKRLLERMMEADIFVLPSHIENSPNSLCEAMIIGMPCITTLAGGSSSLLRDKTEGLVIQDGDPWSMAGAILEMASNEEMAIEYGVRARERALQRHDRSKIVNDLLQIYNQIRS